MFKTVIELINMLRDMGAIDLKKDFIATKRIYIVRAIINDIPHNFICTWNKVYQEYGFKLGTN